MEIEIISKSNNPLLNRTEVNFKIKHEGEKTPDKEIIRSELASKINANKENIIIDHIQSSYGIQECMGYAKIYSSNKKAEEIERIYILKRNKIISKEEKKDTDKKSEEKPEDQIEAPSKVEVKQEEPQKEEKNINQNEKDETTEETKKE